MKKKLIEYGYIVLDYQLCLICVLQVCPICAALPGGDPNHVTDDFAAHLTLEHRAPRDFVSLQTTSITMQQMLQNIHVILFGCSIKRMNIFLNNYLLFRGRTKLSTFSLTNKTVVGRGGVNNK